MLDRIIKKGKDSSPLVFEIGSNSDSSAGKYNYYNLMYTIPRFAEEGTGKLTFPTKFDMVDPSFAGTQRKDHFL